MSCKRGAGELGPISAVPRAQILQNRSLLQAGTPLHLLPLPEMAFTLTLAFTPAACSVRRMLFIQRQIQHTLKVNAVHHRPTSLHRRSSAVVARGARCRWSFSVTAKQQPGATCSCSKRAAAAAAKQQPRFGTVASARSTTSGTRRPLSKHGKHHHHRGRPFQTGVVFLVCAHWRSCRWHSCWHW